MLALSLKVTHEVELLVSEGCDLASDLVSDLVSEGCDWARRNTRAQPRGTPRRPYSAVGPPLAEVPTLY